MAFMIPHRILFFQKNKECNNDSRQTADCRCTSGTETPFAASCETALFLFLRPEELVQGFSENPADRDAQIDGGVIVAFLNRADRLARNAGELCQVVLGQEIGRAHV